MTITDSDTSEGPKRAMDAKARLTEEDLKRRVAELEELLRTSQAEAKKAMSSGDPFGGLDSDIFRPMGLVLPKGVTLPEFGQIFATLYELQNRIHFMLGDLLVQGEDFFDDEVWQALSLKYSWVTLSEWRRICRALPLTYRVEGVSWAHHKYVADLRDADGNPLREEQVRLLRHARDTEGWTTEDTRFEVQAIRLRYQHDDPPTADGDDDGPATVTSTKPRVRTYELVITGTGVDPRKLESLVLGIEDYALKERANRGLVDGVEIVRRRRVVE